MRFLASTTLAIATLFGLELGMQARNGYPFQLEAASPPQCNLVGHDDPKLGYIPKDLVGHKSSTKPELILLGDSIVAGHGFEDFKDSIGPRLERELATHGLDLNVRSLGVAGYNLSQQIRLLELEILKERKIPPRGILMTLNAGDADNALKLNSNCLLVDPTFTSASKMNIKAALQLQSIRQLIVAKALPIINQTGISSYIGPQLIAVLKSRLKSPLWQEASRDLERVKRLTKKLNIPIAMVIFPYSAELSVPLDQNPLVTFLKAFTAKAEIPALVVLESISDLTPGEAYLEGNALHINTTSLDRIIPKLSAIVLGF